MASLDVTQNKVLITSIYIEQNNLFLYSDKSLLDLAFRSRINMMIQEAGWSSIIFFLNILIFIFDQMFELWFKIFSCMYIFNQNAFKMRSK